MRQCGAATRFKPAHVLVDSPDKTHERIAGRKRPCGDRWFGAISRSHRQHHLRVPVYLREANPKAGSRRRADKGGDADCTADGYPEAEVNFHDRPNVSL